MRLIQRGQRPATEGGGQRDDGGPPVQGATASQTHQARTNRGGRSRPSARSNTTLREMSGRKESPSRGGSNAAEADGSAAAAQHDAQALHLCLSAWTNLACGAAWGDAEASSSWAS